MQTNITYWLDESAKKFPDKIAFADENKEMSFGELQRKTRAVASQIISKKLFKKPIAIYLEKSADVVVSFLGGGV